MIYIKSQAEIAVMRQGGRILAKILKSLLAEVKPGTSTAYLEGQAASMMAKAGGRPAFKGYDMGGGIFFPSILCISINDEVVHGGALPDRILENGDIVDIDLGMEWPIKEETRKKIGAPRNPHSELGGYYTDMCATVPVGKISREKKKLLSITRDCLSLAIEQAKPGNTLNDIGRAVEGLASAHGFGVVRDLVGHGVGYFAHEAPNVVNYEINPRSRDNLVLRPGMVIAIEPMINLGDWRVEMADNDYTIITADGSVSAHFEHTVAITEKGNEIITAL